MDHNYDKPYLYHTEESESQYSQNILEDDNTDCDAMIIDAVRGYPHLYSKSNKNFKDKNMRDTSWTEISNNLNLSGM